MALCYLDLSAADLIPRKDDPKTLRRFDLRLDFAESAAAGFLAHCPCIWPQGLEQVSGYNVVVEAAALINE